jgi:hypothetical protein
MLFHGSTTANLLTWRLISYKMLQNNAFSKYMPALVQFPNPLPLLRLYCVRKFLLILYCVRYNVVVTIIVFSPRLGLILQLLFTWRNRWFLDDVQMWFPYQGVPVCMLRMWHAHRTVHISNFLKLTPTSVRRNYVSGSGEYYRCLVRNRILSPLRS